jgi:excisionase family DNA binding protein
MLPKPAARFLTSVEVAAVCGVSPRTVSNWIRDGVIAAHRTVGGHGRVAVSDLRRFLVERRMPVPPELGGSVRDPGLAPQQDRVEPRPRPRVLVIDDDEVLLEVMREVLSASGLDVETARHGFLAGYLLGHYRPDVILLDILMPGLDGYEVLSLMRRRPEARGIPVVACTSLKGPDVESRLRSAGFDGYARKPLDFRSLVDTIRGLLR